jgi:predicted transcriptional regulator
MHHNTTHETGETLRTYQSHAIKQEAAVLALFRLLRSTMAPSEVCDQVNRIHGKGWLLTSIRRAMTNLADEGLLVRTSIKRTGPHGRPEYRWILGEGQ